MSLTLACASDLWVVSDNSMFMTVNYVCTAAINSWIFGFGICVEECLLSTARIVLCACHLLTKMGTRAKG